MKNVFETFVWQCNKCQVWGAGSEGKDFECISNCDGEIVKTFYAEFWEMDEHEKEGIKMYRDDIKRLNTIIKTGGMTQFLDCASDFATDEDEGIL